MSNTHVNPAFTGTLDAFSGFRTPAVGRITQLTTAPITVHQVHTAPKSGDNEPDKRPAGGIRVRAYLGPDKQYRAYQPRATDPECNATLYLDKP